MSLDSPTSTVRRTFAPSSSSNVVSVATNTTVVPLKIARVEEDDDDRDPVLARARRWVAADPNPRTARRVADSIERSATDPSARRELDALFREGRVQFGTAGLRAIAAPGPHGLNELVAAQTARGLGRYHRRRRGDVRPLVAVVGYDHRAFPELGCSSRGLARIVRRVLLCEEGFDRVLSLRGRSFDDDDERGGGFVPTPLVSFAVVETGASCGIMVTASHNPKEYAGIKVFGPDGCQIRSPVDREIQKEILLAVTETGATTGDAHLTNLDDNDDDDVAETERLADAYFSAMRRDGLATGLGRAAVDAAARRDDLPPVVVAHTSLHGVGHDWARRAFETFGLPPFADVPFQRRPDPDFPSVVVPNPEEAIALAPARRHCDERFPNHRHVVLLANDPDADRLAVAERTVDGDDKGEPEWRIFTGDEIGVLIGHWLWETVGKHCGRPVAMVASCVCSSMLSRVAKIEGFRYETTPPGFKHVGARSLALADEGYRVLLAYEESVGFSCGSVVPDKDGVSAAAVAAEMAYHVRAVERRSLGERLEGLRERYGHFVSHNGYFSGVSGSVVDVRSIAASVAERARRFHRSGVVVGGRYRVSAAETSSDGTTTLRFDEQKISTRIRASGTEPKLKYYLEAAGAIGRSRAEVAEELEETAAVLLRELVEPERRGLTNSRERDERSER